MKSESASPTHPTEDGVAHRCEYHEMGVTGGHFRVCLPLSFFQVFSIANSAVLNNLSPNYLTTCITIYVFTIQLLKKGEDIVQEANAHWLIALECSPSSAYGNTHLNASFCVIFCFAYLIGFSFWFVFEGLFCLIGICIFLMRIFYFMSFTHFSVGNTVFFLSICMCFPHKYTNYG